jgi:hypothetical protein
MSRDCLWSSLQRCIVLYCTGRPYFYTGVVMPEWICIFGKAFLCSPLDSIGWAELWLTFAHHSRDLIRSLLHHKYIDTYTSVCVSQSLSFQLFGRCYQKYTILKLKRFHTWIYNFSFDSFQYLIHSKWLLIAKLTTICKNVSSIICIVHLYLYCLNLLTLK